MPLNFFKDEVTIKRAPFTVKNGMQVRDWSNAAEHNVGGCLLTPMSTSRDFDRTEQDTERMNLRAAYVADIQEGDRVIYESKVYEIEGEVFKTKSPTGRISSTRCTLVRWVG